MENHQTQSLPQEGQQHFARILPIVGPSLRQARVALAGLPQARAIVTYLAACGVRRWWWLQPPDGSALALQANLRTHHGSALNLKATLLSQTAWEAAIPTERPDLVIAMGHPTELKHALKAATATQVPALLISQPGPLYPGQAFSVFPGDNQADITPALETATGVVTARPSICWDWITAAPLCASLARAMLLRHTPYARADLAELWAAGVRVLTFGEARDPFTPAWSTPAKASTDVAEGEHHPPGPFRTPVARRGRTLIAGLGSLGSIAALHLAPHTAGMVVADPDRVDLYNPIRQAYPMSAIGQPKTRVLRNKLLAAGVTDVVALDTALSDEREIARLIADHDITAALVVTGTAADFALARALRASNVPHIVGRCYPRARYWEAMVVDGRRGPALSDLRGQLALGPTPPPTPEQIAAYSQAGALEAEPATLIESGWAAAWLARLTAQLLAPPGLRERWFLELLAAQRTCLIGGVGVEATPGGPAYGISRPGAVRAWGQAEIQFPV